MRNIYTKPLLKFCLYIIASTIALSGLSLFNHYPLVFSDTGTYVLSAYTLDPPQDRPIGYSLFIRAVTWKASMWPVVFAQGFLCSLLLWHLIRVLSGKASMKRHATTIIILLFTSSLAWYSNQLMPDIFTSITFISLYLILADAHKKWWHYALYISSLFLGCITHSSHMALIPVIIAGWMAIYFLKKDYFHSNFSWKNIIIAGTVWLSGIAFLTMYNASKGRDMQLNRYVFITARLSANGMLKKYIYDHPNKYAGFDILRDSLPTTEAEFIWNPNGTSPYYRIYHGNGDEANKAFGIIIKDLITTPKYWPAILWDIFITTLQQFCSVSTGSSLGPFGLDSAPYWVIDQHVHEAHTYITSMQQYGFFRELPIANLLNYLTLAISTLIIFLSWNKKWLSSHLKIYILLAFLFMLANAGITGCLANVYDRLQARATWPWVLAALVIGLKFLEEKVWKKYIQIKISDRLQ
jgi:hypothetical protein